MARRLARSREDEARFEAEKEARSASEKEEREARSAEMQERRRELDSLGRYKPAKGVSRREDHVLPRYHDYTLNTTKNALLYIKFGLLCFKRLLNECHVPGP